VNKSRALLRALETAHTSRKVKEARRKP